MLSRFIEAKARERGLQVQWCRYDNFKPLSLHSLTPDLRNINPRNMGPKGHSSKKELQEKYFGQLTKDQMDKVFSLYKLDYLLYGYRPDIFYKFAKDA